MRAIGPLLLIGGLFYAACTTDPPDPESGAAALTSPESSPEMGGEYFGQPRPGPRAEPFAVHVLAAREDHYIRAITFSYDGKEAFWPVIDMQDDLRRWIVTSRIEDGVWTRPRATGFTDRKYYDDVPCLSPDGQRLLFLSYRPLGEGEFAEKENIWMSTRDGAGWSEPAPLPGAVNAFGSLHQQVSLDNENRLYFAAEAPGGMGSLDIYSSDLMNGAYRQPVNLGPVINGPEPEYAPFISPDGEYLIFTKHRGDEWSLYISFRTGDGGWTPPSDLRESIPGTEGKLIGNPVVTHDGRSLIFFGEEGETVSPLWTDTSFFQLQRTKILTGLENEE